LNLDSCIPDYIVCKETDIERISTIAGIRAVKFEEKALTERNRKLIMECVKEREKKGSEKKEREKFYKENGFSSKGIKQLRERGKEVSEIIRVREKERIEQWLDNKIRESL